MRRATCRPHSNDRAPPRPRRREHPSRLKTPPGAAPHPEAFSRLSSYAQTGLSEPTPHQPPAAAASAATPSSPADVEGRKPSANSNPFVRPSYRAPNPQVVYFTLITRI